MSQLFIFSMLQPSFLSKNISSTPLLSYGFTICVDALVGHSFLDELCLYYFHYSRIFNHKPSSFHLIFWHNSCTNRSEPNIFSIILFSSLFWLVYVLEPSAFCQGCWFLQVAVIHTFAFIVWNSMVGLKLSIYHKILVFCPIDLGQLNAQFLLSNSLWRSHS